MSEPSETIVSRLSETRRFEPSDEFRKNARIASLADYQKLYRESLDEPDAFWKRETASLRFKTPWHTISEWKPPHAKWFLGATLNVTESCLDQHLETAVKDKRALVWEGEPEEDGKPEIRTLTYGELHAKVVAFASALASLGVSKGDRVVIYMGMVPEVVIAMLASARLGAVHSIVFGGFAAEALRDRVNDCQAKVVITQDGAYRRGNVVPMKAAVDAAVAHCLSVQHVVMFPRLGPEKCAVTMREGRDLLWDEAIEKAEGNGGEHACIVDAEHPLFILYTSGSTGKPKGVLHTTGGYLAGAHVSTKYVFDLKDEDVYWCTADVGWITGHTYVVYGPLSNGVTVLLYEGAPNAPDAGRFWRVIERHRVSVLYTAPTAIRAFMRWGDDWPKKSDLSSLRLLGSVGEPINPEAWVWYHGVVGGGRCPVVDTWWQTETGSVLLVTLPGVTFAKPGATGLPFFGVDLSVVKKGGEVCAPGDGGLLVLNRPWPSILRTIWGDDDRFKAQYFGEIEGKYFTGDGARVDEDGYHWVVGRIDDVLNIAGHRVGTAEIESAVVAHPSVAEAAAVGRPDDLKGQVLVVFVTLKQGQPTTPEMKEAIREQVSRDVGKFARPDEIRFADALPKTRSGKIMRRFLKDVAAGKSLTGDTSTLEDFTVLAALAKDEELASRSSFGGHASHRNQHEGAKGRRGRSCPLRPFASSCFWVLGQNDAASGIGFVHGSSSAALVVSIALREACLPSKPTRRGEGAKGSELPSSSLRFFVFLGVGPERCSQRDRLRSRVVERRARGSSRFRNERLLVWVKWSLCRYENPLAGDDFAPGCGFLGVRRRRRQTGV